MTHLELENLASDYLEGQLEAARRVEVEQHLAACPSCREVMEGIRGVLALCRAAEALEPPPWLISNILRATLGPRKPTLKEKLLAFMRPGLQPQFAYTVAMAVFSFSVILSAARIHLQNLTLSRLSPRVLAYRATRTGYMLYAHAEKFYYDLRVVYEIESRLRELRAQPADPAGESPKPDIAPGGTSEGQPPGGPQAASLRGLPRPGPPAARIGAGWRPARSTVADRGGSRSR